MSSNVGLSTPRGSGTSGYVQRNLSLLKPRDRSYVSSFQSDADAEERQIFKQRQPDKQILEHDRRRQIEVEVLEERDRLEEENEQLEEKGAQNKGNDSSEKRKLSEEEIEERLDALRTRLTKALEDELAGRTVSDPRNRDTHRGEKRKHGDYGGEGREKRQFKTYQVHELAEAKIEESERFRKALGIRDDGEDSPRSAGRKDWDRVERQQRDDRKDSRYNDDRDRRDGGRRSRYSRDDR